MADLDITGRVTVDASQAEGAFDRVGQRAGQMSDAVAGAATRAGDAVGRIGAGAEAGAETLTRSQSRMRDQIIRSTEAIENLGKTASQKLEIKIATQGLDPNIYAPYLARLREVEAAQAALRASGREAAAGAEEAGSAFDLLASKLAGFNVSAKDALVGLAAGFSAGAFVGWIKGAIDSADAASKLASSAGLAVEELAGLQLAFEGADAGNQLQATLSKLASEAQKGNAAFAAMGITVNNSSGGLKSTRDLLAEVSDKFAGYRDGAEKTALAQQLLGESGAALIPLFNGGSAALDEFDESAKALGLTLSTEAAEAAGNFNDQIDLITQRSQGLARQLASELLPVLSTVSEQFGSAAKQGSSFSLIGTGLSVVLETITVVGSDVAFVLRTLARDALLVYNSAVKLATLDFSGIKSGFAAYKAETGDARKALEQFQAAVITARAVATAGDLDEPWVKRARMEAEQATEASKKLAPQIRDEAAARDANKKATEAETAALKARLAAAASANAAFDEEFKTIEAARMATEARIKTGRELLQTIERETALLGLSNVDREQAIALFALERAGVVAGTEAYDAFAASIREAISARGDKQALLDAVAAAKAAEDQLAQFGLLKSEVQALTLVRLEDARESAALAGEDVANIQKRIDAQKRLIAATAGLEVKEVNKKAADDAAKEWQKTADSINSSLTDALMRGFEDGKGFAKNLRDTLVNMFKTMVLRPTISAILAPVSAALGGTANAAGGGGGVGDVTSLFTQMNSSVSNTIGTAFTKFATSRSGQSLGLSSMQPMGPVPGGMGPQLTGMGESMGSALGVVGNTLAGYAMGSMARSLISGGYSAGKGMDTFQKVGIAVGSAIGGPVVGAIIGAGAGVFNRVFGRKLKDSGIEGTFGGQEGFTGNSFEFLKGGLLRSDKTNRSALDPEIQKGLAKDFNAMRVQVSTFATALGLSTDRIAGYTGTIKLSLKGLSPEDANKKIQEALDTQSNELAKQVLGSWETTVKTVTDRIATGFWDNETFEDRTREVTTSAYTASPFAKEGELAIDTLKRLSTSLLTVNAVFDTLGVGALTIERAVKGWFTGIKTVTETGGLAVADLASKLIDAFGGMDQFTAATGTYYEAFYSERERTETGVRQLTATLAKLGLALPDAAAEDALDQYRALVDQQDLNTESGRTAYAALVTLGSGFAQLVESVSATTKALKAEGANLQVGLLSAKGDDVGAQAAQRAIDTLDFTAAEIALYDYNEALRDQIKVATEATDLQERLHAATDTTAQAAARARAAIDPLNQALYDTVTAAEAAKAASETQKGFAEKYAAPITATSAAAALGPDVMASIAGKGADQIREFARAYVSSLDPLTEAGQKAIAAFDKLTPSIDFFIDAADVATTKADELAKGLVESVGISANTIGDTFRDVLLGRTDAKEAGESVSKMVRDGILNSLAGGFSQQITQIMVGQIITPMVQAAVAGTSISAAVSQDAIDNMLTAARNASAVLGQLFADEDFRGVLADISAAIGSATQALVPAVQPIVDLAPAADSAAIAVESLGDALGRFGESLNLRADLTAPNGGTGSSYKGSMVFDPSLSGLSQNEGPKILSQWLKDQAQGLQDSFDGQAADIDKARGLLSASALQTAVKTLEGDIKRLVPIFSARAFNEGLTQFTGFFTNLGAFGIKLADELAATNDTAIGSALNLVAISDYFTGLGVEIAAVQTELGKAAALAGGGISIDAITTGFADTIGGAATGIGAAITASLLDKVPEAIRNDPNLAGVSTAILGIVGAVKKDDVQGLNDSFLLLSGALTRGELTALQYTTAIDYVTGTFKGSGEAVSNTAATLDDVKKSLAAVQTDIARIGFTSFQLALAEIQDRADEAAAAFGSMAPEIVALADAERTLLNARNAITAKDTLDGLAKEVARINFTPLERELASISDRAQDYIDGLIDLGQGTDANIAAVKAWEEAMRNAAKSGGAAANDLNAAMAEVGRLFNLRNSAGELGDRLQAAMGGKGSFAQQREAELWAALSQTANPEKQLELAGKLTDLVLARQQIEVQNAQRLLDFGKGLRGYVDSLKLGALSPLTNAEKLAEASRQYQDTLAKADGGDESAKSALQGISDAYLKAAQVYYAGDERYEAIFGKVTGSLDSLGVSAMTDAQRQLDVGTSSLAELQKLYSITETAYSALDGQYESAVAQLAAMQDALVLQTDSLDQLKALGTTMAGLPAEIAVRLPVIDTSAADAKAEKASADLLDELRALRSEVAQLRAESRQDAQMQAGVTAASADASAERIAQASAQAVRANAVQQGATLV